MVKEAVIGFEKLNRAELDRFASMMNSAGWHIMNAHGPGQISHNLLAELWPAYREAQMELYARPEPTAYHVRSKQLGY